VIDVFHNVLSNMTFARVYVLAQQAAPAAPKIRGKKKQKLDFDYLVVSPNY
jgi:hypothetical protein